MTVPGVGPSTAPCLKATIDDPTRFKRSRSVGAYVGLTTRRHASGEIDWTGRISNPSAPWIARQRHTAGNRRRNISFAIGIVSMEMSLSVAFARGAFGTGRSHHEGTVG